MAYDYLVVGGVAEVDPTTLLATLRGALGNVVLSVTLYSATGELPYPTGAADVLLDTTPENADLESQVASICRSAKSIPAVILANDEWTIPQPAPLDALRMSAPGPGQVLINDPSNFLSITTEQLYSSQGDVGGTTYAVGLTPVLPGQALLLDNPNAASQFYAGLIADGNWRTIPGSSISGLLRGALNLGTSIYSSQDGVSTANPTGDSHTPNTGITLGFARSMDGQLWIIKGGVLNWIDDFLNTDVLFPLIINPNTAVVANSGIGNYRVINLSGQWLTDIASINIPSPATATPFQSDFGAFYEISYTLPAVPIAGDRFEIDFRYQDSLNYWAAYITYTGAAWDYHVDKVIAGVTTSLRVVAGVGDTVALRVYNRYWGNDAWGQTKTAAGVWTSRGGTALDASLFGVSNIQVVNVNGSIDRLKAWPESQSLYSSLMASFPADNPAFIFGDGSDGDATISQAVTLVRDMYFQNLTITATGNLNPSGYRIYIRGKLSIAQGGKISVSGGNGGAGGGSPSAGGAAGVAAYAAGGTLPAGTDGGQGGGSTANAATNGAQGVTLATILFTAQAPFEWRAGGGGFGGAQHGTADGLRNTPIGPNCGARGGNGGAATGAGVTSRRGGGGGAGGGVLWIAAHEIDNDGSILALGGDGGNGFTNVDISGNGGGGGGGAVIVLYHFLSGNGLSSIFATGGAAGTGGNGGTAGADGIVVTLRA